MNNMLGECDYRTPCKWCTKWDKPCDKKQGVNNLNINDHQKTLADIYPTIESGIHLLRGDKE